MSRSKVCDWYTLLTFWSDRCMTFWSDRCICSSSHSCPGPRSSYRGLPGELQIQQFWYFLRSKLNDASWNIPQLLPHPQLDSILRLRCTAVQLQRRCCRVHQLCRRESKGCQIRRFSADLPLTAWWCHTWRVHGWPAR